MTAYRGARLHVRRNHIPVRIGLHSACFVRGPRVDVVGKDYAVANEDFVFDGDAFANETVRGDFTPLTDAGILLNLDKAADLRPLPNTAAIEIHKRWLRDHNVGGELDVTCDRHLANRSQSVMRPPWALMLRCAASRMRTTRSPDSPSVSGSLPSRMHSAKWRTTFCSGSSLRET